MRISFLSWVLLLVNFGINAMQDPKQILASMSLEEKVAQLLVVATVSNEENNQELMQKWKNMTSCRIDHSYVFNLAKTIKPGGYIVYGANTTPQEICALIQKLKSSTTHYPLFFVDAETSATQRIKDNIVSFPCAMTLGAIQDTTLIYKLGKTLGNQLLLLGFDCSCTPVCDINAPENPIIGARAFGSTPENVTQHALALMKGLHQVGIITCAKHFPGHGNVKDDSHEKLPRVTDSLKTFQECTLKPFKELIDAGIETVMIAHLEVPALEEKKGLPSSLSHAIVTTLLQEELGFKGIAVSDAFCMKGITDYAKAGEREVMALKAGMGLILCPEDPELAVTRIVKAVKNKEISEETINKRALKILELKYKHPKTRFDGATFQRIWNNLTQKAQNLKKELYTKAITLAKSSTAKPFTRTGKETVLIIGDKSAPFEAMLKKLEMPYMNLSKEQPINENNALRQIIATNDHIIVSINNMSWDRSTNYNIPSVTFDVLQLLKEQGKKVTTLLFGSPYCIPQFKEYDTIVMAYENDNEAQKAAAKVICGTIEADGILPIDPYIQPIE